MDPQDLRGALDKGMTFWPGAAQRQAPPRGRPQGAGVGLVDDPTTVQWTDRSLCGMTLIKIGSHLELEVLLADDDDGAGYGLVMRLYSGYLVAATY